MKSLSGDLEYLDGDLTVLQYISYGSTHITIPKSVMRIVTGDSINFASSRVTNTLSSLLFENGSLISIIGSYAFYQCQFLRQIDLSVCFNLTTIESYAFHGCSSLSNIVLPPNLEHLSTRMLSSTNVSFISIPWSVKSFGSYLFADSKVKNISYQIDCQVSTIFDHCFRGCPFSTIFIPKSITCLYGALFEGCGNLESIIVEDGGVFCSENGLLMDISKTTIYEVAKRIGGVCYIPDTVVSINGASMCNTYQLESIIMNNNVLNIGGFAIYSSGIRNCTLSNSLTTISTYLFYNCQSLKYIIIPNSVISIGSYAFYNCKSLESLVLPSGVSIGQSAFTFINPNIEISFGTGSKYFLENGIIYQEFYQSIVTSIGQLTLNTLFVHDNVTTIGINAFSQQTSLITVEFSSCSTLKTISERAFINCINLQRFLCPSSVQYIHTYAFYGCSSLTNFTFSNIITTINEYAFYNTNITNVVIPSNVTRISQYAFYQCRMISLTFSSPSLISTIDMYAFSSTPKLDSFAFPSSISSLGPYIFSQSKINHVSFPSLCNLNSIQIKVFSQSQLLTSIVMPQQITSISESSFEDCISLQSFYLPTSVQSIQFMAFAKCVKLSQFVIESGSQLIMIEQRSFFQCNNLFDFTVSNTNDFQSENGLLMDSQRTKIYVFLSANSRKSIIIPNTVSSIDRFSFQDCHNLESIVLPESVGYIGFRSFSNCSRLSYLEIHNETIIISSEAFLYCASLECHSVHSPPSIQSQLIASGIPQNAFEFCPSKIFTHNPIMPNSYYHLFLLFIAMVIK